MLHAGDGADGILLSEHPHQLFGLVAQLFGVHNGAGERTGQFVRHGLAVRGRRFDTERKSFN